MDELEKLYQTAKQQGLYTKSYDEFVARFSDSTARKRLFDVVKSRGLYTKSIQEFDSQYFSAPLKKKGPTGSPSLDGKSPLLLQENKPADTSRPFGTSGYSQFGLNAPSAPPTPANPEPVVTDPIAEEVASPQSPAPWGQINQTKPAPERQLGFGGTLTDPAKKYAETPKQIQVANQPPIKSPEKQAEIEATTKVMKEQAIPEKKVEALGKKLKEEGWESLDQFFKVKKKYDADELLDDDQLEEFAYIDSIDVADEELRQVTGKLLKANVPNDKMAENPEFAAAFEKYKKAEAAHEQYVQQRNADIDEKIAERMRFQAAPGMPDWRREELQKEIETLDAQKQKFFVDSPEVAYSKNKEGIDEMKIPGKTAKERLVNYYLILQEEKDKLLDELYPNRDKGKVGAREFMAKQLPNPVAGLAGFLLGSQAESIARDIVPLGMNDQELAKKKRLATVIQTLRQIAPPLLVNRTPLKSDDGFFSTAFKTATNILAPATESLGVSTQKKDADILSVALATASITPNDINRGVNKNIENKVASQEAWGENWAGDIVGTVGGIALPFAFGGGVISATKIPSLLTRASLIVTAATRGNQINKLLKVRKYAKFLATATEEGLAYKAAGFLSPDDSIVKDDATFTSGFVGSAFQQVANKFIGPKVMTTLFNKLFGTNATQAAKLVANIGGRAAGGAGETVQEFGETVGQLVDFYQKTNDWEQTKKQFDDQFGTLDKSMQFFVSTLFMGMAMGNGTQLGRQMTAKSKDQYDAMTPEQQDIANQIISTYHGEIKATTIEAVKEDIKNGAKPPKNIPFTDEQKAAVAEAKQILIDNNVSPEELTKAADIVNDANVQQMNNDIAQALEADKTQKAEETTGKSLAREIGEEVLDGEDEEKAKIEAIESDRKQALAQLPNNGTVAEGDVVTTTQEADVINAEFDAKIEAVKAETAKAQANTEPIAAKTEAIAKQVEQLRVAEQAEYDAMPDQKNEAQRKEIYNRYDKLITPLLEQQKAQKESVAKAEGAKTEPISSEKTARQGAAKKVAKALEKTGVKVRFVTSEEMAKESQKRGSSAGNEGVFLADSGEILIDEDNFQEGWGTTVIWHEGVHPILNIIRNTDPKTYNAAVRGLKAAAKTNPKLAEVLKWADTNYKGDSKFTINDESITESIARIADGKIDLSLVPKGARQVIADFINKIAKALGLGQIAGDSDLTKFRKLAGQISTALTEGRDISEVVGEQNVTKYDGFVLGANDGQFRIKKENKTTKKPSKNKKIKRPFDETLIEYTDIDELDGKDATAFLGDKQVVADVESPTGVKFKGKGGPFYPVWANQKELKKLQEKAISIIKNGQVWATTDLKGGTKLLNALKRGSVAAIGTQAPEGILGNKMMLEHYAMLLQESIKTYDTIISDKKSSKESVLAAEASKEGLIKAINNPLVTNYKVGITYKEKIISSLDSIEKSKKSTEEQKDAARKSLDLLSADGFTSVQELYDAMYDLTYELRSGYFTKVFNIGNSNKFDLPSIKEGANYKYDKTILEYANEPVFESADYGDIVGFVEYDPETLKLVKTVEEDEFHHKSYHYVITGDIKAIKYFNNAIDARAIFYESKPATEGENVNQTQFGLREKAQAARGVMGSMPLNKVNSAKVKARQEQYKKGVIPQFSKGSRGREAFDETGFISTDTMIKIVASNNPNYLGDVMSHIVEMGDKLKKGAVTTKDLSKAYLMAISSIRSGSINTTTFENAVGEKVDQAFLEPGGKIRTEGAMAYLITTDRGKDFLKHVELGKITQEDKNFIAKSMKPFGMFGEGQTKYETLFGATPADQINLTNIEAFKEILKGGVANEQELFDKIRRLKQISQGKVGFVSNFLGIGTRGVIDVREIQAWLRGAIFKDTLSPAEKKIVTQLTQSEEELNPTQKAILGRMKDVGDAFGIDPAIAPYIGHHMVWDASAGQRTTHDGLYLAMKQTQSEFDSRLAEIRAKPQASKGNRELLAPNGNTSNLNEVQYNQVRTPEFKKWFGDWEKDPDNASKVVDENGEPKVVYHGSVANNIEVFDRGMAKRESSGLKEFGYYFTTNEKLAELYSKAPVKEGAENADGKIYQAFLNLRKVKEFNAKGQGGVEAWRNLEVDAGYKIANNRDAMEFLKDGRFGIEAVDGIVANNIVDAEIGDKSKAGELKGTAYLVFDDKKNSIKSATDNSGNFSTTDNRIQASKGNRDATSSVAATTKALEEKLNPDYKKTIVEKLSKFDAQINSSDSRLPSALAVAEGVLPRAIFNKYKNLYELAARNNITVSNHKSPDGYTAAWAYGSVQIDKQTVKYGVEDYAEFADVLNHEIIHGLISRGIKSNYAVSTDLQDVMKQVIANFDSASSSVKEIIAYIQDTRREFSDKDIWGATDKELESDNLREVGSLEELITYAFTNKEFADFLDTIPATKGVDIKGNSIFQQLKNIIRGLVTKLTKNPTALDEINSVMDKYFDTAWQEENIAKRNEDYGWGLKFEANKSAFDKYKNNPKAIAEAYHKGDDSKLVKAVDAVFNEAPVLQEKVQASKGNREPAINEKAVKAVEKLYNKRYGDISKIKEAGAKILDKALAGTTYFSGVLKNANNNYVFIPVTVELSEYEGDSATYKFLPKPNENTEVITTYQEWDTEKIRPVPVMYDKTLVDKDGKIIDDKYTSLNNRDLDIRSGDFDEKHLFRGMSKAELDSAIERGYIKSDARANLGGQEDTTSFAQYPSQATNYAAGFTGWHDDATFNNPKYVVKVTKKGIDFKPTIDTEPRLEVDVSGKVPISSIVEVHELRLASAEAGTIDMRERYPGDAIIEGSRNGMHQKIVVRKMDLSELSTKAQASKGNREVGSVVLNETNKNFNGLPISSASGTVYHRTNAGVNDIVKNGFTIPTQGRAKYGYGVYFNTEPKQTSFGANQVSADLDGLNLVDLTGIDPLDQIDEFDKAVSSGDGRMDYNEVTDKIKAAGIDGVISDSEVVIFDSNKLKNVKEATSQEKVETKSETLNIFAKAKALNDARSTEASIAKKRELAQERRKLMEDNPTMKEVDDNIRSINEQLEGAGIIKKKGDCP
tara:strand:+ start:11565 stop:20720 length:9156 start_codon:yes stop_codon:yes gene_type:complete